MTFCLSSRCRLPMVLGALLPLVSARGAAQDTHGVNLAIHGNGISIGDTRGINGLRLNYRDSRLETVNGGNVTIWTPRGDATGVVRGAALGVPVTGARTITGLALGVGGAGADDRIVGVGIGGLGLGAGGELAGIMVGGLGVGSGGGMDGIAIGGLGAGSGGRIRGIVIAGLGAGSGAGVTGIAVAGLGIGAGGDVKGIAIGGLGVGAGGDITGITAALIGVGAGGDVTGVNVGGVGVGAGGTLTGLNIAGLGVGAPRVVGVAIAGAVGGADVTGFVIAPGVLRITDEGRFTGASLSAFNYVKGEQHGVTIGIVNYARELFGVQLGLLNFAKNNPVPFRLLPILNVHVE